MNIPQLGFWECGSRVWRITVVLGGLSTACQDRSGTVRPGPGGSDTLGRTSGITDSLRPPPLAKGCPPNRPPQTASELKACVSNLDFDTLPEVGDEQRLLVMDSQPGSPCPDNQKRICRYGPLAKIEPLKNAHTYSPGEIREGRIIARLSIQGGQEGYPKLSLFPGHKTYWWVLRDESGTGGQSVYISDSISADRPLAQPRKLQAYDVPAGTFKQALARWLWLPDDETAKGTCGSASCK
jgi:hypothetical protein